MASNDEDLCTSHADFAVICSFIDKFGEKLGLTLPNIGELQIFFEDTDNAVNPLLAQGVCLLLRRINKSVKFDRWERGLQRFAHTYSHQDGWELERFGFKKAKLEVKIRVFKNLLEAQFDLYKSFKDKVNLLGAPELRLQPCGRDKKGVSYWCQLDECANLRIYCDDQDEETWTLVASTREELVALIAELQSESPPGASREMSVDGSRSGTVTPMGLSEAPTPVDSKAATPVASGRTSPVIDTGQIKDDSIKVEEKKIKSEAVVEKIKEKLKIEKSEPKLEENEAVQKDREKLDGITEKQKEERNENRQPKKLLDDKDTNENAEPVVMKGNATKGKELEFKQSVNAGEQKREDGSSPPRIDNRPEEKPLPVNKDTVMRERDKKPEKFDPYEKSEVKKKETVWDKLSKQKEERAEGNPYEKDVKEMVKSQVGFERLLDGKPSIKISKLNREVDNRILADSQKRVEIRPKEMTHAIAKVGEERKTEYKVSDSGQGPRQDRLVMKSESLKEPKESHAAIHHIGSAISSIHKSVVEKAFKSSFPTSIGSVSITPVQTPKDRLSTLATTGAETTIRNLPSSITIKSSSKLPLSSSSGPRIPLPTSEVGHLSPTSTSGSISLTSVSANRGGSFSPTFKGGPLSPTSIPTGKSGALSPTSVMHSRGGPLSPTSVMHSRGGPLSPTSVMHSRGGPLSPPSVSSGKSGPLSPSSAPFNKDAPHVQTSVQSTGAPQSSTEGEKLSRGPHSVSVVKCLSSTVSHPSVSIASSKCAPSSQYTVPTTADSSSSTVQYSKIASSSREAATSNIPLSSLPISKSLSSPEAAATKNVQYSHSTVPPITHAQSRKSVCDNSSSLASEDIIPPFPPVPTKGTQPTTPKDAPPTTSVLTLKCIPPLTPVSAPEAIPPSNTRAPPLDSETHQVPTEAAMSLSLAPFPPAPGTFPSVPALTAKDVPPSALVPVGKDKSYKYFSAPSQLAPSSTCIPTPCTKGPSACKAPPFDQMAPLIPSNSNVSSASPPFPQVPTSFPLVPLTSKDTPPASVVPTCKNTQSSTYFTSPSKFTASPHIPTPPTCAPSVLKDVTLIEPPQKKVKVGGVESESQKESPKETQLGLGHSLNLLKRTHVNNPGDQKDVGGPHEAKVMKKEGAIVGTMKEETEEMEAGMQNQEKTEGSPGKVPQLSGGTLLGTKQTHIKNVSENKANTEVEKYSESTRRLLKPHSFCREPTTIKPGASNLCTNLTKTSVAHNEHVVKINVDKSSSEKKEECEVTINESDVGEAIEEPVMIVEGEGEGANCESGNDLHYLDKYHRSHSSKPWWECFDSSSSSSSNNVVTCEDNCETIEEHVMYFWGDGNGVDCDAGNNGDETETNAETKQGESGSSTVVAADRGNSASSEVKPQKDKETSRTDSEVKEMDGIPESDEAKVNGLRTLESVEKSDKTLNQPEKTESKGVGKHSGVNGKKSKEDNDVCGEKTSISNKNSKLGEGKNKKDKSLEKENSENVVNDKSVSDKEEKGLGKVQRQDSSKSKESDKSNVEFEQVKKTLRCSVEIKESSRETCAKRGTRNRASLEEVKDVSEESDRDEDDDESYRESQSVKKKRGRPKGSTLAARARRMKQTRAGSQRVSDEEEEEIENEEEDDDILEPAKKRRQRGKGSTARPLPDVPRQRSARIAKIREKEEEERRHLEALRMKQLAEENRLKELKRKAREERRAVREVKKGRREKKEKKDKEKKKKKKKKRAKKKPNLTGDPWDNTSSSSSSSSEEDEIEEEEEDENLEFKSDHEFSPESDIEDADAQPIKRARTAKKGKNKVPTKTDIEDEEEEDAEEESEEDQTQCTKCGHDDHPETILLCDNCDAGWHLSCLRPPLLSVPEGDWICPTCEHVLLVKKLKEVLEQFDECQKKAQNEELRRQRIAYVNVSLDNILPEGGKKKKKKRLREDGEEEEDDESGSDSDSDDSDSESDDSSGSSSESSTESEAPLYTLRARSARTLKEQVEDFDEMINEAIRDEMEAAAGAGNAGRGKDIDNIIQANTEEEVEEEEVEEEEECKEEVKDDEVENKENEKPEEKPVVEIQEAKEDKEDKEDEEDKEEKKEESEEVKREREIDEDEDEDVAPKRKKQKPEENGSGKDGENDEDYKESDEHRDSESEEEVKTVRKRSRPYNMFFKKRRRLTDLDAEDDDDASDEDFMNSSEDEDEESEESAMSSSSLATEYDSDDSDVGGKRRRGSRYDNQPLRRSARNRRSGPYEEDTDEEKYVKRVKKKKKRRKSSSEEEEESSDSERSYNKRKKKINQRRRPFARSKGRKGSKKGRGGRKQSKSKAKSKPKKPAGDGEEEEKPAAKPRIKYSKPPKPKNEDQEEEVATQRRVTRGRQVNYYDALLMSDETDEEEPQKKWRGKVMKGERVPTESSEYEASEDEMKKRRGICGGQGRGKVMKGEEEDEDESKLDKGKKKRGRPKKGDEELIGKPSPPRPSTIKPTPVIQPSSPTPPAPFVQATSLSTSPAPVKQVTPVPTPARVKPAATDPPTSAPPATVPVTAPPATVPSTAPPASYVAAAASPVHRTPEPAGSPSPAAPVSAPTTKVLPTNIAAASNLGNNSPGHQQPLGKWSPHLSGVTITNVSVSSAPGTPPRPNMGSAPGSGTPPRPSLSGPPVTASPPPPYRSSPLPMTSVGRGAPPTSTAPSTLPPGGPPNTSSPHSTAYPPYRPPPEHYPPHPAKERFPSHPAFPEYAPPGRHSPNPHGVPPRHPSHVPSGHSHPHLPAGYGPPGPGSYPPGGVPPHPGVLRGPPHDLYRPPHSTHPGHGSPSHPGHPHLVMKPGYPGLEPLPYSGSPGPSPGPIGIHQGSQDSPAQQSPNEDSKEGTLPTSKGPGEFSSGLMSYFSSQRDDDVE